MIGEPVLTTCPGCLLRLPASGQDPPVKVHASAECWQAYSDLLCYTVSHRHPAFIHQNVVDAYAAQHAGGPSRAIGVAFGLTGLYLALEKGCTGRQVQRAHMRIARIRKDWPRLDPPARPGAITVADVLRVPEGPARDEMIRCWMEAVWESWTDRQQWVRDVTAEAFAGSRTHPPR